MTTTLTKKKPVRTASQLLARAKKLISKKANWIKGDSAATKLGGPTNPGYGDAVKFCASGAVRHIALTSKSLDLEAPSRIFLEKAMPDSENDVGLCITTYNDRNNRTHPQVMKWFDRAIALAKKEAKKK